MAIAAMPAVVPMPSVQRSRSFVDHVAELPAAHLGGASGSDSSVTITTTLARIGLHAAAKNRRLALR